MSEQALMPFSAPGESPWLDLTTPRDNLRWALGALELAANGLRNRRQLQADDVEMRNLSAAKESVEVALRLIREALQPEGVAIMPELSTVEIQEAICDHMLGLEWRESSGRHKSRCRSDAADVYNAIRAYCLPQ